jgi:hypothetical protein
MGRIAPEAEAVRVEAISPLLEEPLWRAVIFD